jgi:hypothetical protein
MALTKTPIELSSTPSIVDGGNATAITIDSSENVIIGSGNSSITLSTWDSNKSDIAALTSSSDFGGLIEGGENGSLVLGIQDNDNTDAVYILSGSGNYMTDSTYDKVVFKAAASGDVTIGGNLTGVTDLYVDDQIISTGDTNTYMQFHGADSWRVVTGGSERFHIEGASVVFNHDGHDQDFRIESDTNTHMLHVDAGNNSVGVGITGQSGVQFYCDAPGSTHAAVFRNDSAAFAPIISDNQDGSGTRYFMSFRLDNTEVGKITSTGSATVYATSSDYRLKENVDYTWDATTRLKQLKPARFNFIADETDTLVDGFLAHEVSSIVPEAISGEKDAVDADGNPDHQGIDQSKLVPLLVKTIQELEARITTLEG